MRCAKALHEVASNMDATSRWSDAASSSTRRGGHQQRATKRAKQAEPPIGESVLATLLLGFWAWGIVSAVMVQRIAHAAHTDGLAHPSIVRLASIGAKGRYKQNARRDLQHILHSDYAIRTDWSMVCNIPMLVKQNALLVPGVAAQCFILPFVVLGHMCTHYPNAFQKLWTGPIHAIANFWSNVHPDDPRLLDNAALRNSAQNNMVVPIKIHGDGVPCTKKKSLNVFSISSMLGVGSSLQLKIMLTAIFGHICLRDGSTERDIWVVLIWVLKVLRSGRYPSHNWLGELIMDPKWAVGEFFAGGVQFVVWCITGDMEWFALHLFLEHYGSDSPCLGCRCNRLPGGMGWSNWGPTCEWKATCWNSHLEFILSRTRIHPLFTVPGISIFMVRFDTLHVVCLGVTGYVLGNALFYLVRHGYFSNKPTEDACASIFAEIQEFYSASNAYASKSTIASFILGMVIDPKNLGGSFPCLRHMKAAESRHLAPAVLSLFREHSRHTVVEQHILASLEGLVGYYECADPKYGYRLPSAIATKLQSHINAVLLHYHWLNKWAIESGLMMFNEVPKFHYFWHIGQQSEHMNPTEGWVYLDEDYVGQISIAAHACTFSTSAANVSVKLCVNVLTGSVILWKHI
jgi:hypothetical protein